ncbi:hypothetical protein RJT34_17775 [Clitoria ternatea]|uniref:RNase H type-1 domain-containing protein n=1 Tax=Clitoria ternatea TaxID=43366 RepID=A0AAN9J9Y9_CLITE
MVNGSYLANFDTMDEGEVLLDAIGNWIPGFLGCLGSGNLFLAKLIALHKGLQMMWDVGYKHVMYVIDYELNYLIGLQMLEILMIISIEKYWVKFILFLFLRRRFQIQLNVTDTSTPFAPSLRHL